MYQPWATDSIFEKLISFLGKSLGMGAILIALVFGTAGLGLWLLQNWGRILTLALVGVWRLFGLLGLLRHPGMFHFVRVVVDGAIIVYLILPKVTQFFRSA